MSLKEEKKRLEMMAKVKVVSEQPEKKRKKKKNCIHDQLWLK